MNFWRELRIAEVRSRLLFICFIIVVTLCVFAPYFFVHAAVASARVVWNNKEGFPPLSAFIFPILDGWRFWRYPYFPVVAVLVLLPVLWGALRRLRELRKGGHAVANMLNAVPVRCSTRDFREKRLLNVVEEMSIASGVPMPGVYLMEDEPGVNAVTAGFSGNDAVVCATRGATELLTRNELQGVVAHEFSHILNGDMFLHTATLAMMRGFFISKDLKNKLDVSGGSSGYILRDMFLLVIQLVSMILLLPFWLWMYDLIFGGIGKMVKAAFFRKREYLADANAARFTRFPAGLAGAMKKILAIPAIQTIRVTGGDEANHLFFHEPLASPFSFLVASHPSVAARIRKLDPVFDGKIDELDIPALKKKIRELRESVSPHVSSTSSIAPSSAKQLDNAASPGLSGMPRRDRAAQFGAFVGGVNPADLAVAAGLLDELSKHSDEFVSSPEDAMACVLSMLLDDERPELRSYQKDFLKEAYSAELAELVESLSEMTTTLSPDSLATLLDRCVSLLRELSRIEYDTFANSCRTLVLADDEITLLEYSVTAFVRRRLDAYFGFSEIHPASRRDLSSLKLETELLLSIMSWVGADSATSAGRAFAAAAAELPANLADRLSLQSLKPFDSDAANRAVSALSVVRADDKELLFNACFAAVGADDTVSRSEWLLTRLFAMMLGCPLPAAMTDNLATRHSN
ncbi:MAG: M48 family metalloprotease [Victivallales bacterium]|nr:M48 family metalloprotease [Victivallales bacterium]